MCSLRARTRTLHTQDANTSLSLLLAYKRNEKYTFFFLGLQKLCVLFAPAPAHYTHAKREHVIFITFNMRKQRKWYVFRPRASKTVCSVRARIRTLHTHTHTHTHTRREHFIFLTFDIRKQRKLYVFLPLASKTICFCSRPRTHTTHTQDADA